MWKSNVLLGLATAAIATYVLISSFGHTYMVAFGPGPGFAPRWVAGILLLISLVYVAVNLYKRDDTEPFPLPLPAAIRAAGLFIVLGASILLIDRLGFTIALALFMIVVLKLFEGRPWVFSISVGTLTSASVFVVFSLLFKVPLPRLIPGAF